MNDTRWVSAMHKGRQGYVLMEHRGMTRAPFRGMKSEPIWKPMPIMRMKGGVTVATEKTLFIDIERSPMVASPVGEVYIRALEFKNE